MLTDDYYEILQVPRDASEKEIAQAYRRMVKLYHPDLNPDLPDAERHIRSVLIAYQTLGDRRRRADYDRIMQLFGSRDRAGAGYEVAANTVRINQASAIERRRREARRPVLAWLAVVLTGLFTFYLWHSDSFSRSVLRHWTITPTIYSQNMPKPANPSDIFVKVPVEDKWYLWYRTLDYQLLRGSYGSARGLAEAYAEASLRAFKQERIDAAKRYAAMAYRIDPGYDKAVRMMRLLDMKTAASKP